MRYRVHITAPEHGYTALVDAPTPDVAKFTALRSAGLDDEPAWELSPAEHAERAGMPATSVLVSVEEADVATYGTEEG